MPIVLLHLTLALVGPWLAPYSTTEFHTRGARILGFTTNLAEDLSPSDRELDVADGSLFSVGDVIRVDDELIYVSGITTNTLTVVRAHEGTVRTSHQVETTILGPITRAREELNSSDPSFDVLDASQFRVGDVIRIGNERMEITEIAGNTLSVMRGHLDTDPTAHSSLRQLEPPSWRFWLGTDQYGRDILSRIMSGATSIILVAGSGTIFGIGLGAAIGMSSAYKGGAVDAVVMRIVDGLMSFPTLLLALLVLTTLGPSNVNIVATVAIVTLPRVARVLRSVTLSLKQLEFVQSARLRGENTPYIIFKEILPNTLTVLGVELSIRMSYAILAVSSLGFLGMGVQPPSPDWGLMIAQGRGFLDGAPWVTLAPAGAIASLVVGINLLTDGIKQASGLPREDRP